MMKFLAIAGLALAAGLTTTAEAQGRGYADGRSYVDRHGDRDDRFGPQRARNIHYWHDSLGRTCYRRSDGVRRCEDRSRGRDEHGRRYR